MILRPPNSHRTEPLFPVTTFCRSYGYCALAFSPASRWLFWIWRDARNRPTRLYRTSVDGKVTDLVYEEKDPAIFMGVKRTAAGGFVALTLAGPETAEDRKSTRLNSSH